MQITIDPEFKALVQPLQPNEYQGLEQSLIKEGCRDALVLWNDILLDGHNRYEICTRLNIPFNTINIELLNRNKAKIWIILNQFNRRNLSAFQRSELALELKSLIAEEARERQVAGGKEKVVQISAQAGKTRDVIAKQAGVSHDTKMDVN